MYTAQQTIGRIQATIKEKGVAQKDVLKQCGINENTLKRMTDNKGMSSFYLARIADLLGVSVDYLLGRTDTPTGTYSISNNNTTVNGTQANIINNSGNSDTLTKQFLEEFETLCFDDKVSVMQFVKEIKKPSDNGRWK